MRDVDACRLTESCFFFYSTSVHTVDTYCILSMAKHYVCLYIFIYVVWPALWGRTLEYVLFMARRRPM